MKLVCILRTKMPIFRKSERGEKIQISDKRIHRIVMCKKLLKRTKQPYDYMLWYLRNMNTRA